MADAKTPAAADHVHVKFPSQYRHLVPTQVYYMSFGQVFSYRNENPACPKPELQGANAAAYMEFEKATLKKLKR